jgi:thiamine biosynthesis lipoprotein
VEVEDLAVMGSGDYERFFEKNGKRYHHIFNPKTGFPAEGVIGTTLIHADPVLANVWSKPIFVLGPERGMQVVERIPGMEAIVVWTSGEILYSLGLKHALQSITKNQ